MLAVHRTPGIPEKAAYGWAYLDVSMKKSCLASLEKANLFSLNNARQQSTAPGS